VNLTSILFAFVGVDALKGQTKSQQTDGWVGGVSVSLRRYIRSRWLRVHCAQFYWEVVCADAGNIANASEPLHFEGEALPKYQV
jgi:uncharacterized membrane protein